MKFDRDNPSRVIASTPGAVIWSNDGGDTWSDAYFEGKIVIAESIAAGRSRFYIYTRSAQLLSSQDGGRTWAGTRPPLTIIGGLEVDAQDNRVIYASIPGGPGRVVIAKSGDAGVTWANLAPVGGPGTVYQTLVDPVRSGVLYLGILGERFQFSYDYYKSTDGGASWRSLTIPLPGGAVPRMAIDTAHPDTLYVTRLADGRQTINIARSTDGGASWQVNATNLLPNFGDAYFVVTDAVDHGTLYSGGLGIVYRSVDFGVSWTGINTPSFDVTVSNMKIVADPKRSKRLFALPRDGFFRTDDASRWTEITNGINARSVGYQPDEPRITAVTASGLNLPLRYYSSVDRREWTRISVSEVPIQTLEYANPPWSARRYALVPLAADAHFEGDPHESLLYSTSNDGATWTSRKITGSDVPDVLRAVSDTDVGVVPQVMVGSYDIQACFPHYCRVTSRQLVLSNDGGSTWHKSGPLPTGIPILATILHAGITAQLPIIIVALDTGMAQSIDGGASFQMISSQTVGSTVGAALYADPNHSSVLFLTTTVPSLPSVTTGLRGLYRSVDGGVTWTAAVFDVPLWRGTGMIEDIAFSASRPDRVDVVTQSGMLVRSDDAGLTWTTISSGPGEGGGFAKFGRKEPRTAYIGLPYRGIKSYTIERDGPVGVTEFHHTTLDHYFLTLNADEAQGIDRGAAGLGWVRTGVAFRAWLSSSVAPSDARPVCRFYGTPGRGPNSHFYTANPVECAEVKGDPGWTYEGIAFHVIAPQNDQCPGSSTVHRAYNNGFARNDSNHRYSTQLPLLQAMSAQGWSVEGVAFCGAVN